MNFVKALGQKQKLIVLIGIFIVILGGSVFVLSQPNQIAPKPITVKKPSPTPTKSVSPTLSPTPATTISPTVKPSRAIYTPSYTPTPLIATSTPVPPATATPTAVRYQDTNPPSFGALVPPQNVPISYNDVCLKVYDIKDNDSTADQIYIQFSIDGSISGLSKSVEKCYNDLANGHHEGWIKVHDYWGNVTTMNIAFDVNVLSPTPVPTL